MRAVTSADVPGIPAGDSDPCSNSGVRHPSKQGLDFLGIDLTREPGRLARHRPRTAGLGVSALSIRLFGPGFGSVGNPPSKPRRFDEALRGDANRTICTIGTSTLDGFPASATD